MSEVLKKTRGEAKRALIAQAHRVANELEGTANMVRGRLDLLEHKEIDEWTCITGILTDLATIHVEMGVPALVEKLGAFQAADHAYFDSMREHNVSP